MIRVVFASLLLVSVVGCTATGTRPDGIDGEGEGEGSELGAFAQSFLDAHNEARATATPTPSPALPELAWSTSLAETAQAWAERCVFEHSSNDYGENLAVLSARDVDADTAAEVVGLWDGERADYDYGSNGCAAGAQCGHYTQLVWRDTVNVGCGVADCANIGGFGPGTLWVCNYDPPGNWLGERPY